LKCIIAGYCQGFRKGLIAGYCQGHRKGENGWLRYIYDI